ncbi:MAG: hypothetical protein D6781_02550 [Verrucomicrobia bacterium]|nr:MAG: hypothetical protein D6781_02550 [Verrucomicrobiota bacterium]
MATAEKSVRLRRVSWRFLLGAILAWAALPAVTYGNVDEAIGRIMKRVEAKANHGRTTEADLTSELLMLSDLQERVKSRKADAAEVLLAKAGVYLMVIGDLEMGAILLDQVRYEFPGTPAAMKAEALLAQAAQQAPQRGGTHRGPGYRRSGRP